jgi:hypothetical protein
MNSDRRPGTKVTQAVYTLEIGGIPNHSADIASGSFQNEVMRLGEVLASTSGEKLLVYSSTETLGLYELI